MLLTPPQPHALLAKAYMYENSLFFKWGNITTARIELSHLEYYVNRRGP